MVIFLCLTVHTNSRAQTDSSRLQLDETIAAFYSAISRGDAGARVTLLDSGAILMPNGYPMIRGREKVAEVFTSDTSHYIFLIKDRTVVELSLTDTMAYTVNSYYYTWHLKGSPPNWRKTKNVHIWKKNKAGKWKLHVDIWNSDIPIEFKPQ